MMPWVTGVVLLVFPVAVADFDYRYLLLVLPFADWPWRPRLRPGRARAAAARAAQLRALPGLTATRHRGASPFDSFRAPSPLGRAEVG